MVPITLPYSLVIYQILSRVILCYALYLSLFFYFQHHFSKSGSFYCSLESLSTFDLSFCLHGSLSFILHTKNTFLIHGYHITALSKSLSHIEWRSQSFAWCLKPVCLDCQEYFLPPPVISTSSLIMKCIIHVLSWSQVVSSIWMSFPFICIILFFTSQLKWCLFRGSLITL